MKPALPLPLVALAAAVPAHAQCELAKLLPPGPPDSTVFGRGLAMDGLYAVITAPTLSPFDGRDEVAYFYERSGGPGPDPWVRVAKLKASDHGRHDDFGFVVDLSGDLLVAGADLHDHTGVGQVLGAAYVFERVGGQWTEVAELSASDGMPWDYFGWDVAIDGERIVVGAGGADDFGKSSGKAYVFDRVGGQWQESAILYGSAPDPYDRFGWSVAVDGDRVLVGAQSGEGVIPDTGAAHVFDLTPNGWVETTTLWADDGSFDSAFSYAMELEGDRAVVGAMWADTHGNLSGAAYVFEESGGTWSQVASLVPASAGPQRMLGADVALDGDRALVGAAPSSGGGTGSAHLFERTPTGWVERLATSAEDLQPGNLYGVEVELEGDRALVSAIWDDEVANLAGAVHDLSLPPFATALGACGQPSSCGLVDPFGGCPNSTGAGAAFGVCGSNRLSDDALVLRAWRLPPGEVGAFVLGTERHRRPFGDGQLLVGLGGAYARLGPWHTGTGVVQQGPGWLASTGALIAPGSTWILQLVYTDATGPCGTGFNATNAVAVTFVP